MALLEGKAAELILEALIEAGVSWHGSKSTERVFAMRLLFDKGGAPFFEFEGAVNRPRKRKAVTGTTIKLRVIDDPLSPELREASRKIWGAIQAQVEAQMTEAITGGADSSVPIAKEHSRYFESGVKRLRGAWLGSGDWSWFRHGYAPNQKAAHALEELGVESAAITTPSPNKKIDSVKNIDSVAVAAYVPGDEYKANRPSRGGGQKDAKPKSDAKEPPAGGYTCKHCTKPIEKKGDDWVHIGFEPGQIFHPAEPFDNQVSGT